VTSTCANLLVTQGKTTGNFASQEGLANPIH